MSETDLAVISTVIAEAKKSYQDSGVDHATLVKLERLWKKKLMLLTPEEEEEEERGEEDLEEEPGSIQEEEEVEDAPPKKAQMIQLDGNAESSEEEEEDDQEDDSDSDLDTDEEEELDDVGEDMGPPCSDDDVSDEEIGMSADLFDTENVVVCQYDKISRNRNKWKFHLKNGVMKLEGRDFVFGKAHGEVDW